MDDKKDGWKRFQKLKINRTSLSSRAKRAELITTKHAHKFVVDRLNNIMDVRQHVSLWLLGVAVIIAAIGFQMIWNQDGYRAEATIAGGTYAEAVRGPIDTLNPLYARSMAEQSAAKLLFSSLYDYDDTGHLRSDLATDYKLDVTKKIYTVSLRHDAKWQDGSNVTADDVVFTINLIKNPDTRSVLLSSWSSVSATVIDKYTVQFTLPAAYASFPHALTFAVLPKHILDSVSPGTLRENTFSLSPTGSGPFSLRLLQTTGGSADKVAYFTAWDKYYRGAPKVARFELHAYNDNGQIMTALKTHNVNAAVTTNVDTSKLSSSYSTASYPVENGVYALFNNESSILKDAKVRRALQLGTDTSQVRKKLGNDAPALDLPFLPAQFDNATMPIKPAYNLESAKNLLQSDGWLASKDGARTKGKDKLRIKIVSTKSSDYHDIATELSRQWNTLGIETDIVEFDTTQGGQSFARSILQPRDYDVLVNELAIGADPDVFAYWHSSQASMSGLNFSNYRNGLADDALLSARLRDEPVLRNEKYKTFATEWLRDAPAIGLYQSVMRYTHTKQSSPALDDSTILPTLSDRYSNVLYWTAERGQVYKTP